MSTKTKFYPRMAISNVKKNGTYYFAYLFTCLFTVAMFYIMGAVTFDDSLKSLPDFQAMILIMRFGTAIIGIFSVVFLFYTNSFLMKRRQKEFGKNALAEEPPTPAACSVTVTRSFSLMIPLFK